MSALANRSRSETVPQQLRIEEVDELGEDAPAGAADPVASETTGTGPSPWRAMRAGDPPTMR